MLRFTLAQYQEVRRHGEQTYPHECCGILLGASFGDTRTVSLVLPCGNTRTDSPQNRYNIDPRELMRAQREANELGLDIVGFYHSHPDHPPRWSPTDLSDAHWIGCSYVITSVEKGKASLTNSYALTGTTEEDKALVHEDVVVSD